MSNKRKIFNDPVYGLVSFPFDILYDIIEHPYFQRLRRINQMGLSHFVYPGACHSRFHHALGALHLVSKSITTLRNKKVEISDEEFEAVCIAILLHDVGHGPFSHTLEKKIIPFHHEDISLEIMKRLNQEFNGRLDLAIKIFENSYSRVFFHQLVSSQLDMDRMDYLNRDSFFTGVVEGKVGYDRIISMINVVDDQMVIEEKALYSVEKFFLARIMMYWQVYLHKTAISAEQMLKRVFELVHTNGNEEEHLSKQLFSLLKKFEISGDNISCDEILDEFVLLDDHDIWYSLKNLVYSRDSATSFLCNSLLHRKLFRIEFAKESINSDQVKQIRQKISRHFKVNDDDAANLMITGIESNQAYTTAKKEILILKKTGQIIPFSELSENLINTQVMVKHFLCYPRI